MTWELFGIFLQIMQIIKIVSTYVWLFTRMCVSGNKFNTLQTPCRFYLSSVRIARAHEQVDLLSIEVLYSLLSPQVRIKKCDPKKSFAGVTRASHMRFSMILARLTRWGEAKRKGCYWIYFDAKQLAHLKLSTSVWVRQKMVARYDAMQCDAMWYDCVLTMIL